MDRLKSAGSREAEEGAVGRISNKQRTKKKKKKQEKKKGAGEETDMNQLQREISSLNYETL